MKTTFLLYDFDLHTILDKHPEVGSGIPARLILEDDQTPDNPNPIPIQRRFGPATPRPTNLGYIVDLPRPTISLATQAYGGQVIDEEAKTRSWEVRPLTEEEIAARTQVRKADRVSFEIAILEILGIKLSDVAGFIEAMPETDSEGLPDEDLIREKEVARIRFAGSQNMKETDELLIAIATNMVNAELISYDAGPDPTPEGVTAAKQAAVATTVDAIFTRAQQINIELQ